MRHAGRTKALVSSWFDFLPPGLRDLAQLVRGLIGHAGPELQEGIKWGNLVFALDGLPVLALASAKSHLNLQLLQGAPWPAALDAGPAHRGQRQLRLLPGQPPDPVLVEMLVAAAVHHGRERVGERARAQALPSEAAD